MEIRTPIIIVPGIHTNKNIHIQTSAFALDLEENAHRFGETIFICSFERWMLYSYKNNTIEYHDKLYIKK